MADTDRELALRITADAAQAKAELAELKTGTDSLTASTTGVATATTGAATAMGTETVAAAATTAAIREQGVETTRVETILELKARLTEERNARQISALNGLRDQTNFTNVAMSDLGNATVVGGAKMEVALLAARNAVAALEVEQGKLRAAGLIVPPQNVALLQSYDNQVKALSASTTVLGTTTAKTTAEKRLFTTATAQAGQAIAGGTVNMGMMTAGFLRFLGPVGLGIAALTLLPTLVRSLSDAFKTLAGFVGDNMSKAVGEMVEGFGKAQEKLEGLEPASRSYRDATDLLTASGLNASKTFEAMAGSGALVTDELVQMGEGFGQLTTPFDQARGAADRFYEQLNRIRTVDPAFARKLTEEFIRLSKSASDGTITADEFSDQLRALQGSLTPLVKVSEDVGTAIGERFGKKADEARAAFGALMATAQSLDGRLKELNAGGLTSSQAFDVLKTEILKTALESEKFAGIIPKLSPQMQAWIVNIKDLAKGHDAVSVAIDKVRATTQESVNTFNTIFAALDEGTQKLGTRAAALAALSPTIEKLIGNIEKQRDSEGNLSVSNQVMLDELAKLQKESGSLSTEAGKLSAMFDEQARKTAGVIEKLRELDKAYREDAAEIEKHRAKAITSAHEEEDAARQSAITQLQALADKKLSQAEYLVEYQRIQAEETAAHRKAQDEQAKINEESRADLAKTTKDFREKSQDVQQASATTSVAFAAQVRAANAAVEKINDIGTATIAASAAAVPAADTITAALDRIRAMAVQVDLATTSAFRTGGSSQLSSGPTSGGHTSVGESEGSSAGLP